MKNTLIILFIGLNSFIFAQIPVLNSGEKKLCYQKSIDRNKNRYAEWECGKLAGVIDCNEKLELNPGNIVVSSAGKKPYSGQCETCFSSGMLERRVTFVEGRSSGIDTTFYESGCMMVIRSHVAGVENGKWTYFRDSTGLLEWEKNYTLGELNGDQLDYKGKDTLKYEIYVNGKLQGPKVSYNSIGKRSKVANYKEGLLDGAFLIYNKDELIIEESYYKEGKKNGVFKFYYDDGVLLRTENWNMGAKAGEFKMFYYDQKIQSIENYKKANGKVEEYITVDSYECTSREMANKIATMLHEKKTKKQIVEAIGTEEVVNIYEDRAITQEMKPHLKGKKLITGLNEPYLLKKKYYIVFVHRIDNIAKTDVKEGWFEERFPNQKPKRKALYKNDVLVEEHVWNEVGEEIRTYGAQPFSGNEDDALPTSKKDQKKKAKAQKKADKKKAKEAKKNKGKNPAEGEKKE